MSLANVQTSGTEMFPVKRYTCSVSAVLKSKTVTGEKQSFAICSPNNEL